MLEKEPTKRIRAAEALRHPYFTATKKLQKVPSYENLDIEKNSEGDDQVPDVRPKKTSLFAKPLRIPYLTKENAVDPSHEELNSFVTKEPLFAGEKKN
jgi:hypothetical protein